MTDTVPVFVKNINVAKPVGLSLDKVREIKHLLNNNVPVKVIALDYNRSLCSIYAIKHGLSYRDIV
jgi:hypothetical protein